MNTTELARMLFGNVEADDRWAAEAARERNYLQRKLDELEDDQVYEMSEIESGWSVIKYTVTKRTAKFIHLGREEIYSRGFRLPRQPLEAGEWVWRRHRHFELGRTIRPRMEQLVAGHTATIANHEAARRQRIANQRRWGMSLTDDQLDQVSRLASAMGIRGAPTVRQGGDLGRVNWMVEGF